MGYGHRFETVIDAADLLRNEPVTFLFIGGGSQWAIVDEARTAQKFDNILLHEYVPKLITPHIMASSHCALITLRDEILGVMSPSKLHSNLAMRLPVIYVGPEKSNVDDAIRDYKCGISLRHGQAQELADFIRNLLDDEKRRSKMSDLARKAFDEAFNDERSLPRFDEVIEAVTGARTLQNATSSSHEPAAPETEDANVTIRS